MSIRNRQSRPAGTPGVFAKRRGRNAQKHLAPNDRDVERALRRLSPAALSDLPADADDSADAAGAKAGFADERRTP